MKRILNYLFVLSLLVCAYGCGDDDQFKRIYPDEEQVPFEREDVKGVLSYDESRKRWVIRPDNDDYFRPMFEDGWIFYIDNMKEEYKSFEGTVLFSGTFLYLYYEARLPMTGSSGGCKIYSLQIKDIQKREKESPF